MSTSEHKQFILTHKDTFSRSHLTKQPTGKRTDTSLSALRSPFFRNSRPRCYQAWVTLPVFMLFESAQGILGRYRRHHPHLLRPPLQAAGSQRSHFLLGESECRSGDGLGRRKVALSSLSEPLHRPLPPCYQRSQIKADSIHLFYNKNSVYSSL